MRFSTSTLTAGDDVVPWLAAAGELAYSPESPPERDYFFQYSWIVPGVFGSGTNKRLQYWFGDQGKDTPEVRLLFGFWNRARQGDCDALYLSNGRAVPTADVTAPLAAYRHTDDRPSVRGKERLILIQHGSYHIGDIQSQPLVDRGEAVLCNLIRSLCREAGAEPDDPLIRSALYSGYALEEWCASRKFGPNYVKFRTPLTDLCITTFVCRETEVKVIDTNKLEVMEAVGCKVREVFA